MIVQGLIGELKYEAENTRKLLSALTDEILDYKVSEINWTAGELASHIAEIYNWFPQTFLMEEFKLDEYKYDKGDISKVENIVAKFEENYKTALETLEKCSDSDMMVLWKMTMNGKEMLPVMPRIQVSRGFLFNHLYHHRGELIIYMRAYGLVVPSLYGPTYEMQNPS